MKTLWEVFNGTIVGVEENRILRIAQELYEGRRLSVQDSQFLFTTMQRYRDTLRRIALLDHEPTLSLEMKYPRAQGEAMIALNGDLDDRSLGMFQRQSESTRGELCAEAPVESLPARVETVQETDSAHLSSDKQSRIVLRHGGS